MLNSQKFLYAKKEKITALSNVGGTYTVTKKGKIIFYFVGGTGGMSNYMLTLNTAIPFGSRGIVSGERHIWSAEMLVQQGDILKVTACENSYEINNYFVPYE